MDGSATLASSTEHLTALLEQEVAAGRVDLPVMPEVATKVQQVTRRPYHNAQDLAQVIALDPSLAANIVKVANSARYAGLTEVIDLDRAIARLGTDMVVAVVVGVAGKALFRCPISELQAYLASCWRRSLYVAAAARHLATRAEVADEEAFLAGLLHSIGEPLLIRAYAALVEAGKSDRLPAEEVVAAVVPLSPRIGADLLADWSIPSLVVDAIRYRDAPHMAPAEHRRLTAMVALAASMGGMLAGRARPSQVAEKIAGHPSLELLEMTEVRIAPLAMEIASEARQFTGALGR